MERTRNVRTEGRTDGQTEGRRPFLYPPSALRRGIIIATNKLLVKCNITASSICDICNLQIENFNYLFWECTVTQGVWSQVNTDLRKKENSNPFKFPQIFV